MVCGVHLSPKNSNTLNFTDVLGILRQKLVIYNTQFLFIKFTWNSSLLHLFFF